MGSGGVLAYLPKVRSNRTSPSRLKENEMKTQEQMEKSLTPELQEWYRILKGFVDSGNVLVDDGCINKVERVELATKKNGAVAGMVFIVRDSEGYLEEE
jgi:hypothetical protein